MHRMHTYGDTQREANSLDKVEYGDPIPNWGEEAGSIRTEQQVPLAIDGSKQVGKLKIGGVSNSWTTQER